MKFSLDTVGYGGYFTDGAHLSLEDGFPRAADFGYDAAWLFAPRPLALPVGSVARRGERGVEWKEESGFRTGRAALALPLFESQDPDFVRKTVKSMEGLMVYSHSISIATKYTVGGMPFGWDEVQPGSRSEE